MVPNAGPGGLKSKDVPRSQRSARAVAAVRLLMTDSLDLEALMNLIQKRYFVGACFVILAWIDEAAWRSVLTATGIE